jgi:hypothetical protein
MRTVLSKDGTPIAFDQSGHGPALILVAGAMTTRLDEASLATSDHTALLGKDASVPIERAAHVLVPTLVMNGGASYPFMSETARALSQAMPHAQLRKLEGQDHAPAADVLASALKEFFLG